LIAPLGVAMGMPFPLGLRVVSGRAATLIPWAWGVNGCASVVSPVLATVLAVWLGFQVVVLGALALYLMAALLLLQKGKDVTNGMAPGSGAGASPRRM